MTDFRTAGSIGERIQAARKTRGLSARELAEAIGGVPTQSTIENIELGRKAAVDVVQLLNIAMALRVPLSYLLAPMGLPDSGLDLPGLSIEFASMTSSEFDAWLSSVPDGARLPTSIDERNAVSELRLEAALRLQRVDSVVGDDGHQRPLETRLAEARREAERLASFLHSAGWPIRS
jgi:transcriptional regulator with XRE-family HTH domain